ncbi:MAG TPA: sulfotransferase domain-containing protein [Verrucomicrobiae bacterium]|nr:sulfotransferase domain-containing protein [Verrucomicrobiae bacterium]
MFEFPTTAARPVWIASYPRSGNTFLRILLERVFQLPSYSIYYVEGMTHRDPSAEALEEAPRLPRNWRERLKGGMGGVPIAIKTHDLPTDGAPTIFIARDGRAALESYYHYHRKFAFEQPSLTEIIAGACQFGSWSDHYWAWRPKTRSKTLLIRYDELVAAPEQTIQKLAEFLKREPKEVALPEFNELQKKSPAFFRRGQNTDYLKQWTPGQMALFNELHGSAMTDLGFAFEPTTASAGETVKELAHSAARLHQLYLEQLNNLGTFETRHKKEIQQLESEMRQHYSEMDEILSPLLRNRWVRLGIALGAVPPPASEPEPREPVPKPHH